MLSNLNYETRFGILLSFHNFLTYICKDLHSLIFLASHRNFLNFNHIWPIKRSIFGKTNYVTLISEKKNTRIGGTHGEIKKLKSDEP